ncbi:unnamed protein product [Rhizophagus irregularis]|nr:unnamed protein product [Rhizophagus irregularis]
MAFQLYGLQVQVDLIVKKKSPNVAPVNKMMRVANSKSKNAKYFYHYNYNYISKTAPDKYKKSLIIIISDGFSALWSNSKSSLESFVS